MVRELSVQLPQQQVFPVWGKVWQIRAFFPRVHVGWTATCAAKTPLPPPWCEPIMFPLVALILLPIICLPPRLPDLPTLFYLLPPIFLLHFSRTPASWGGGGGLSSASVGALLGRGGSASMWESPQQRINYPKHSQSLDLLPVSLCRRPHP